MTEQPQRVRRCTTHYTACDCREWHYQEALKALRRIQTFAKLLGSRNFDQVGLRQDIVDNCKEVLEAFKTREDK